MSVGVASPAGPDSTASSSATQRSARALVAALAVGTALLLLAEINDGIHPDTWLAILAGREIVAHGLSHPTLTVLAQGHHWIDQQWLGRLIEYGLYRAGGLGLVSLVNAVALVGALIGAVLAARNLGARPRAVLWVLPLSFWCYTVGVTVRPQTFGYPLFVAIVWLLIRDLQSPRRVVFWCLPVLVLWANLHGSVTIGAALVVLRGLTGIVADRTRLRADPRLLARHLTLIVAPVLCVLATPYGLSVISYYRSTLLNPGFHNNVTEWSSVTGYIKLAPVFFALAGLAIWSFWRRPEATTRWERMSLLLTAAGSILAVRNLSWFALLALIVVPRSLPAPRRLPWHDDRLAGVRRRLAFVLTGTGVALACVFGIGLATASQARLTGSRFPVDAVSVLRAQAADPHLRVLASTEYADWLLWQVPAFAHRLAYDISYELITPAQLADIARFESHSGVDWPSLARGYGLLVLQDGSGHAFRRFFGRQPGARILYDRYGLLIIRRPVAPG